MIQKLRAAVFVFKDWLLELNAVKITALITLNCFLLTGVYGQAAAAISENIRATEAFNQIFDEFNLPYSQGKITSAFYGASDTVVISVQDLHSHAEVQKNISKIIEAFDKEFGVKNVYLEGAYGDVDTSWLLSVKDKTLREKVLGEMLLSGRLTGAEYYSALSGRTDIIKGLENREEYFANLQRFGQILEMQPETKMALDAMSEEIASLKSLYYDRDQKKLDELSKQYIDGNINVKKYFTLLYKHTDKLGLDVYKYENINTYKELLSWEKELNYKRVTAELSAFMARIKEILPYSAYKLLLSKTNNLSDTDALYVSLVKIAKEYNLNLKLDYPQLAKFLSYIELSQKINPLELIKEEQKLLDEINEKFSQNDSQREVVFLAGFVKYLKDFLSSKITADDYAYYEINKDEFDALWVKYIDRNTVSLIESNKETADNFYRVNLDRNKYFFDNINGIKEARKLDIDANGNDASAKVINSLRKAKNIYIIVTGGFHTEAVSNYLSERNISNIVITPNVSGGVQFAEEKYYQIAKEQSKILFQALATLNASQQPQAEKLGVMAAALLNALGQNRQQVERQLQDIINGDKQFEGITFEVAAAENGTMFLSFAKDGKRTRLTYNANTKDASFSTAEQDAIDGRQMSVSSRKQVMAVSGVMSLIAVGATVALASLFMWPAAIATLALAFLSSSSFLFAQSEKAKINKILKEKMADSQTANADENIKGKILDALSPKTRQQLAGVDIVLSDKTEALEFGEGKIHINPSVLSRLLSNEVLLETFIRHELRHKKLAESANIFARFAHSIVWLEEFVVSFADLFDYISLKVSSASSDNISAAQKAIDKIWQADGKFAFTAISKEDLVSEIAKLPLSDIKEFEEAADILGADFVRYFMNRQYTLYGGRVGLRAMYGQQTIRQAITAANLFNGDIRELATGAGKTDAFMLAFMKSLANGESVLFLTNTADLAERDIKGDFAAIYGDEQAMKDLGVLKEGEPLKFAFVHESDADKTVVYTWENGKIKETKTDKLAIYQDKSIRAIAGSSMAAFSWDRQDDIWAEDAKKGITSRNWSLYMDEAHRILVQEGNNLFVKSVGERKDAQDKAELQKIAYDIVASHTKGYGYRVSGEKISIINTDLEKEFREKIKNLEFENINKGDITREDINQYLSNAIRARDIFRLDKDYALEIIKEKQADGSEKEKVKVTVLDSNTNEKKGSVTYSNNLHYALELAALEEVNRNPALENFRDKEFVSTRETMQSTSMPVSAFLFDGHITKYGAATGTIDRAAVETLYGKEVKAFEEVQKGADPAQAGMFIAQDNEAQRKKALSILDKITGRDKLPAEGKENSGSLTLTLLRASGNRIDAFERDLKDAGYEVFRIDNENSLPAVNGVQYPTINAAITAIAANATKKTVVLGTNLIATGIDVRPTGNITKMAAIDTVFDKNHDVAKQFADRTGRSGTLGVAVSVLSLEDIVDEDMT
ncbi:MAG: DEAD/DEAH box helicase family protein, partial [Endomicrobium sp.]|nr:DEAD/DEAH box helicase family protein [Endomicrobium sp.]